ncbi:MAG: hypothetical protein IKI11_05510 [Neisseriaceae bacterium]|nr:hypothetical protein [Neisseriaceae bacterium]
MKNKNCNQCKYCRQRLIERRFGLERYVIWVCNHFEIEIRPNERACSDFSEFWG